MDLHREIINGEVIETYVSDSEYIGKVTYRYPVHDKKGETMTDVMKDMLVDYLRNVKKIDI